MNVRLKQIVNMNLELNRWPIYISLLLKVLKNTLLCLMPIFQRLDV